MATPVLVGLGVAAAALVGRSAVQAFQAFKYGPQKFYKVEFNQVPGDSQTILQQGGFLPEMTRREAALILGLRESAAQEKIKEAHRRIIIANHPDAGGSSYVAAKINEAKDMLLGKRSAKNSAF